MISSDQQLTQSCRFVWYQNSKLKKACSNVESSSFYYHRCLVCETRMAHSWRKPSGIRSLAMGSCCEFQIHRRKQIRKRRVIGFFFDFMNEAWCPWFWKVYYRVMFSDGFCVFSSLFEIDFKWFLNFKLGYRSLQDLADLVLPFWFQKFSFSQNGQPKTRTWLPKMYWDVSSRTQHSQPFQTSKDLSVSSRMTSARKFQQQQLRADNNISVASGWRIWPSRSINDKKQGKFMQVSSFDNEETSSLNVLNDHRPFVQVVFFVFYSVYFWWKASNDSSHSSKDLKTCLFLVHLRMAPGVMWKEEAERRNSTQLVVGKRASIGLIPLVVMD